MREEGIVPHTHMFLKCSNVLLFYCRCSTEMKFNNLLYIIPIKLKRFSALLFIIMVQMSSDYSVCMHGQTLTHRDPQIKRSRGWSLLENMMFFLNYFLITELSSQIHINVALRWLKRYI